LVYDVYEQCIVCGVGRTNIVIDDALVEIVMRRLGVRTKTEAVDAALRRLAGEPMTISEALTMRGARVITDVPRDPTP
jgi:Arc/MetJ family transcription regulator